MARLVLCAGMRRSGSTWLYNVLRYCFIGAGMRTYGDYLDRYREDTPADVHVLKIHPLDEALLHRAELVFTTIRDVRDAAASMVRRGLVANRCRDVVACAEGLIAEEYTPWETHSDLEVRYESMIVDRPATVAAVLAVLRLASVSPSDVCSDVEKLDLMRFPDRDRTTQLWPNHITDGGVGTYVETLSRHTVAAVEKVAGDWLATHGYRLGSGSVH